MTRLSTEEVRHIAELALLHLSDAEVERFRTELSALLSHFQILQEVDTEGVSPTTQVEVMQNITRTDSILPSLSQDDVLANAPEEEGGFIKIKPVLD